jgi:hypothetical protein
MGLNIESDSEERAAHPVRRACPTWGARLEGLRASRRTATSETEPAAILRDGAPQVGCSQLAYLMCRSRVNPRSVRLLKDEVCGFKLHPPDAIGFMESIHESGFSARFRSCRRRI